MRLNIAQILTDFSQNNPNTIPPDIIMEYANIPYTVKERIRMAWEAQQKLEQENIDAERALKLAELKMKYDQGEKELEVKAKQSKESGGKKDGNKS
jgi:hypothetical protein